MTITVTIHFVAGWLGWPVTVELYCFNASQLLSQFLILHLPWSHAAKRFVREFKATLGQQMVILRVKYSFKEKVLNNRNKRKANQVTVKFHWDKTECVVFDISG